MFCLQSFQLSAFYFFAKVMPGTVSVTGTPRTSLHLPVNHRSDRTEMLSFGWEKLEISENTSPFWRTRVPQICSKQGGNRVFLLEYLHCFINLKLQEQIHLAVKCLCWPASKGKTSGVHVTRGQFFQAPICQQQTRRQKQCKNVISQRNQYLTDPWSLQCLFLI